MVTPASTIRDRSLSSFGVSLVVHGFVLIVVVATLAPIVHVVAVSLSSAGSIVAGRVSFVPLDITLHSYGLLLRDPLIPGAFRNSIVITVLGTSINLFFTVTMAYPLSKRRLPFRGFFTILVMVTMFFSGGLIPRFMVVKGLGLYNTYGALTIPIAISTFNLIILRSFFKGVPQELEDSAKMDGAGDVTVLVSIVLPLSKAAIATIGLFYAVGHWNSFFTALIYLTDAKRFPLQLILREIVIENQLQTLMAERGQFEALQAQASEYQVSVEGLKYAVTVLSIVPMLMVYPFVQRYFVKGVMIGSLKG